MADPELLCMHLNLKQEYGSDCHKELNALTTLLCKLATTTAGLGFLLRCCRHVVFPRFVADCVQFADRGPNIQWLADRMRLRILRAAIRDSQQRLQ